MISDVLFDANHEIERYLNDPLYSSVYSDETLRNQIKVLAAEMDKIRVYLDTPPIVEAVYESLVDDIKRRCEKANITYKEIILAKESTSIEIFLPQNKEKKSFPVNNIESAKGLLDFPFEGYGFLSSYNAISSHEDDHIEAIISPLKKTSPQEFFDQIINIAKNNFSEAFPGSTDPDLVISSKAIKEPEVFISIGPASQRARVLLGNLSDRSISIKLLGLNVSSYMQTERCLEKYASSVFFQIDSIFDIPLKLEQNRKVVNSASNSNSQSSARLIHPVNQYDDEPLSLYWYARSADEMPLLQYLAFYQVIEFYFPFYSQVKAKKAIKNILKTPGFNAHNDTDIVKVLQTAKLGFGKGFGAESDQLEATMQECLDISRLKYFLEENELRKDYFTKNKNQKMLGLAPFLINDTDDIVRKNIVNRIYRLRCRIVHAKTGSDSDEARSIYPFTPESVLLDWEIELIHYVARQILIANSREFKLDD